MLHHEIRPTSVVGIKRLAKTLKAERGIPHLQALDEAAQIAGFENFRHASNKNPSQTLRAQVKTTHRLFVTGSWRDRATGNQGRETFWVDLTAPWANLVTRSQMRLNRSLARVAPTAEDHLTHEYSFESLYEAQKHVCAVIRTFQFIDATKLRPSNAGSRIYPEGNSNNAIPGWDHSTAWYDPSSKGFVFADEPYEPAAKARARERSDWAEKYDYEVVKPNWPGMYFPTGETGSRLYLISSKKSGPSVNDLASALDQLPPPVTLDNWAGVSTSGSGRFKSPAQLRAEAAPATPAHPKKVEASRTNSTPQVRHPGKMPLEIHEEIGKMLKSVIAETPLRDGACKRLKAVQSTLDDWVQREYNRVELTAERFYEIYYGATPTTIFAKSLTAEQIDKHVLTLEAVKAQLDRHYAKSANKRVLLKIDAAIKSLRTWAPSS